MKKRAEIELTFSIEVKYEDDEFTEDFFKDFNSLIFKMDNYDGRNEAGGRQKLIDEHLVNVATSHMAGYEIDQIDGYWGFKGISFDDAEVVDYSVTPIQEDT